MNVNKNPLLNCNRTSSEKAVTVIKNSDTGNRIRDLVTAAEKSGKSGVDKLNEVLPAANMLILQLVWNGVDWVKAEDTLWLTRAVVESIVADIKPEHIPEAVLKGLVK